MVQVTAADPSWTDVVGVMILGAQLLVLIGAGIVAWRQVREARRLREEQTRPFVIVDFEAEHGVFFFVVENIGSTLARDVRITVSPGLKSSIESGATREIGKLKMFRDGIATLAPGRRIRTIFDIPHQRKSAANLPDEYLAVVEYDDADRRRHFREPIDLDLGIYWNLVRVDRKDLDHVHGQLEKIAETLKSWTVGRQGLLRLSPDDVRARDERFRRAMEERQEQQARSEAQVSEPSDEEPLPELE